MKKHVNVLFEMYVPGGGKLNEETMNEVIQFTKV